jgi:Lar family restriction alleviation protein
MSAAFIRCPFCGSTSQYVLSRQLQAENPDGTFRPQTYYAVACKCEAIGRAAPTEEGAVANWNRRA